MCVLKNSQVRRGGATQGYVETEEDAKITLSTRSTNEMFRGFKMQSSIPSKGGGTTVVQFFIQSSDFAQIANVMAEVDSVRALEAFVSGLEKIRNELSSARRSGRYKPEKREVS